jgi:hypothetical protein
VTSLATPGLKRTFFAEQWRRVQRERAVVALFELGRQKTRGLRAARVYAFGVFLGYAIAIALARGVQQRSLIHGYVQAALASLSWVVGALAALGAAQALAQQADRGALAALAMQRGFGRASLLRARTWAAAFCITRLVAVPALLLVLVGVARGASLEWALGVAPAIVVYAGALGVGLALLAHLSAELAPRHPRAMLFVLVLGPFLLSQAFPALPNVPELTSALLTRLLASGTRLS